MRLGHLEALARRLHLALDPRRQRLGVGARMGAGAGNSLEFHDYRDYQPGDDPRLVDWGVYARTGQLLLRRHRQEIAPRLELILDASLSMGASAEKWLLARECCGLLAAVAERDGSRPRIWLAGESCRPLAGPWREELPRQVCAGSLGLAGPVPELSPGGERILISDGLAPEGGEPVVRRLARGAGSIALVQILSRAERDPAFAGPLRLLDVEGGALDVVVDDATRQAYRQRLARHQAGWRAALAGRGVGLIDCVAEEGFEAALQHLLRQGLLLMDGGA
jgi:uncharacterized protein (DUF58 family)